MAGGPLGLGDHQQGVAVAVQEQVLQLEPVAAGLALDPQLLPAAAPEGHPAGLQGQHQGFGVHVAEHQNRFGVAVLDDSRNQASTFFKINIHVVLLNA